MKAINRREGIKRYSNDLNFGKLVFIPHLRTSALQSIQFDKLVARSWLGIRRL